MIVFNVNCRIAHPVHGTDSAGRPVEIPRGAYRLLGRNAGYDRKQPAGETDGLEFDLVENSEDRTVYRIAPDTLAEAIAYEELSVGL